MNRDRVAGRSIRTETGGRWSHKVTVDTAASRIIQREFGKVARAKFGRRSFTRQSSNPEQNDLCRIIASERFREKKTKKRRKQEDTHMAMSTTVFYIAHRAYAPGF